MVVCQTDSDRENLTMLRKATLLALVTASAAANAGVDVNQIWPPFAVKKTPQHCLNQSFESSFEAFSSFVAEDVKFSGSMLTRIKIAVWMTVPATASSFLTKCRGWKIYIGNAGTLAAGGGLAGVMGMGTTTMGGQVNVIPDSRFIEVSGINIAVTPGATTKIALVPIVDSVDGGVYILRYSLQKPGITPAAAMFFNPGNGFGFGPSVPVTYNAAMRVVTI